MFRILSSRIPFVLGIAGLLFLLASCQKPIERQGVHVWGGISLDSANACPSTTFYHNLRVYRNFDLQGMMIEIPMLVYSNDDSHTFTYYEGHGMDTLVQIFRESGIAYAIHFHLKNPFDVPGSRFQADQYFTDMSGLLLRTALYPPDKIIFSGKFLNEQLVGTALWEFMDNIRQSFEGFEGDLVLAATPAEILDEDFPLDRTDAVGILYPPMAETGLKDYYRKLNSQLSQKLIHQSHPLFIVHSNLLGEDKTLRFKNQLRFWDDRIDLEAITLNTLYCQLSLGDSTTYFALESDQEFHRYLKAYHQP